MVREFFLRGHSEVGDVQALRVDHAEHVANDSALARGVQALKHDEDPAIVAEAGVREEPLLQFVEDALAGLHKLLAMLLLAIPPRCGSAIQRGEVKFFRSA